MAGCCDNECELEWLRERQSGTLKAVLAINAVMFFVVVGAGICAGSTALLSDSLDNLGDAITCGLSLHAVGLGARTKARVALLWRHRTEDVKMNSVWECSRNDIASNFAVLLAAAGAWGTGAGWPDLVAASCLVVLFLRSAARVLSAARAELHRADS